MENILETVKHFARSVADLIYDLHILDAFLSSHPIVLGLLGVITALLLYYWLGSSITERALRRHAREEKENADRLSRELSREKRVKMDASERCKNAEKSTGELQQKLRDIGFEQDAMLSFFPGQMWFIDGEAKMIKASKLELGDIRANLSNCASKTLLDLFGEPATDLQNLVVKAINTRQAMQGHEFSFLNAGKPAHYTFDMYPMLGEDSLFKHLLVIVQDTTPLLESRQRCESVLLRVEDGVCIVLDGEIKYVNPRLEQIFGVGKGDLNGKSFDKVFNAAETKPWKPGPDDMLWNPMNLRLFSTSIQPSEGRPRRVLYTLGHTQWEGREADMMFVRDYEAIARMEHAQQETQAVLEATLDSIEQGVIVTDSQGMIQHYNKRILAVWELSEAIFTVNKWDAVFNSMKTKVVDPAAYENWMSGIVGEGDTRDLVVELKSGRYVQCVGRAYTLDEETSGRVVSFLDVTDSRKRETELQKALDSAEVATQTKSEFLARMSHEIRTPMNGIIGVATLMDRTELNHRQRRYMDVIKVSADSLLDLINDILDFSKIEAGYLKLEKIEFDLVETIGAAADLLSLKAQSKGLRFLTFLKPDVPTFFRGDPNRLRQILINLGNNAIKFTDSGEVVIHCEVDEATDKECTLHFTVSDTGAGIRPEKLDAIFESYEQEDVSTSRQFGGTGLGLAICKHLVELMHGKIWVESVYGEGTDFHFTIRLRYRVDGNLENEIELFESRAPRVLITVANDTTQQFIAETLTFYGVQCAVISSPELAVDALLTAAQSNQGFDLVLMEPFDGVYEEIARKLTSEKDLRDVHCILLTSFAESTSMVIPEDVFVSEMMNLPLKRTELMQTMKRVLGLAPEEAASVCGKAAESAVDSYRVLLAEDNPINQGIVTEILESEGHAVSPANNGEEVLALMEEHEFDVVLMDVHMPVMDGMTATRYIRETEGEGNHQIIIAMTADVLSDDREKCLAAGMDDFITKPLKLDELRRVLHRVMTGEGQSPADCKSGGVSLIDLNHVKETLGADKKIIAKTFDLILRKFPQTSEEFRKALKDEDAPAVHRAAHGMKGFLNYFDVPDLCELVVDMEKAGKNGDLKRARQIFIDLEPMMEVFIKTLEEAREKL